MKNRILWTALFAAIFALVGYVSIQNEGTNTEVLSALIAICFLAAALFTAFGGTLVDVKDATQQWAETEPSIDEEESPSSAGLFFAFALLWAFFGFTGAIVAVVVCVILGITWFVISDVLKAAIRKTA